MYILQFLICLVPEKFVEKLQTAFVIRLIRCCYKLIDYSCR